MITCTDVAMLRFMSCQFVCVMFMFMLMFIFVVMSISLRLNRVS